MPTRVYVEAAGCDRRRLDAASIRTYLEANGYELVGDPAQADRIVAVICAFKEKEEEESVRRLRSLRKYGADVVVYGCLADIAPERFTEFADLPSVAPRNLDDINQHFEDITVPFSEIRGANVVADEKRDLVRVRRRIEAGLIPWQESLDHLRRLGWRRLRGASVTHDIAFNLFVCRGCLGLCSYCAIRRAIGRVTSKPIEEIVAEFRRGLDGGYRTFNILGDDPGCYGLDRSSSLPALLNALFEASESSQAMPTGDGDGATTRFHIREIHPKFLVRYHDEILAAPNASLIAGILCPVQSGSDRVLQLMCREHTSAEVLAAMRRIRERFTDVKLDTQIIAGFPGETDAEFDATLDFVRDARFDSVVVFPYDDKTGSEASALDGKVPQAEIRRRVRRAFRYFRRAGIAAYYNCP